MTSHIRLDTDQLYHDTPATTCCSRYSSFSQGDTKSIFTRLAIITVNWPTISYFNPFLRTFFDIHCFFIYGKFPKSISNYFRALQMIHLVTVMSLKMIQNSMKKFIQSKKDVLRALFVYEKRFNEISLPC